MFSDERAVEAARRAAETFAVAGKDPSRGHFYVSIIKSVLRMIGCGFLIAGSLGMAGLMLLVAEGLGILEELV